MADLATRQYLDRKTGRLTLRIFAFSRKPVLDLIFHTLRCLAIGVVAGLILDCGICTRYYKRFQVGEYRIVE